MHFLLSDHYTLIIFVLWRSPQNVVAHPIDIGEPCRRTSSYSSIIEQDMLHWHCFIPQLQFVHHYGSHIQLSILKHPDFSTWVKACSGCWLTKFNLWANQNYNIECRKRWSFATCGETLFQTLKRILLAMRNIDKNVARGKGMHIVCCF